MAGGRVLGTDSLIKLTVDSLFKLHKRNVELRLAGQTANISYLLDMNEKVYGLSTLGTDKASINTQLLNYNKNLLPEKAAYVIIIGYFGDVESTSGENNTDGVPQSNLAFENASFKTKLENAIAEKQKILAGSFEGFVLWTRVDWHADNNATISFKADKANQKTTATVTDNKIVYTESVSGLILGKGLSPDQTTATVNKIKADFKKPSKGTTVASFLKTSLNLVFGALENTQLANTVIYKFITPSGKVFGMPAGSIAIIEAAKYGPVLSFANNFGNLAVTSTGELDLNQVYTWNNTQKKYLNKNNQIAGITITELADFVDYNTSSEVLVYKNYSPSGKASVCKPFVNFKIIYKDNKCYFTNTNGTESKILDYNSDFIFDKIASECSSLLSTESDDNVPSFYGNLEEVTTSKKTILGKEYEVYKANITGKPLAFDVNIKNLIENLPDDAKNGLTNQDVSIVKPDGFVYKYNKDTKQFVKQNKTLVQYKADLHAGNISKDSEILIEEISNTNGLSSFKANIGYNKNLKPTNSKFTFTATDRAKIQTYQESKFDKFISDKNITSLSTKNEQESSDKFLDGKAIVVHEQNTFELFFKIAKETSAFVKSCNIPERFYNSAKGTEYSSCVVNTPPYMTGVANGVIDEVKSIPDMVCMVTDLALDAEARTAMLNAFSKLTWAKVGDGIVNSGKKAIADFKNPTDVTYHSGGVLSSQIVLTVLFPEGILKKTDNVLDDAADNALDNMSNVVDEISKKADEVVQGVGNLLNAEGKFIDNLLEADYAKYLTRKAGQGKTPRGRLDWKEARDYWLFDSPMARGNAFNKKAVDNFWDRYNEVTLANGKRVDGYTPPSGGKPGEIVSRKATNLEEIELSTFEGYLKEMKTKYPAGEPINAPKYGNELKGKVLEGNQILEIPLSNQSYSQIQDYIDLAKNKYNIEIRFRTE
ncbi:MAG: hypothetical protein U0V72_10285 [Cytophagales bacterium]